MFLVMVEHRGLEPLASTLRTLRATRLRQCPIYFQLYHFVENHTSSTNLCNRPPSPHLSATTFHQVANPAGATLRNLRPTRLRQCPQPTESSQMQPKPHKQSSIPTIIAPPIAECNKKTHRKQSKKEKIRLCQSINRTKNQLFTSARSPNHPKPKEAQ